MPPLHNLVCLTAYGMQNLDLHKNPPKKKEINNP